jgi:hypothetical protein
LSNGFIIQLNTIDHFVDTSDLKTPIKHTIKTIGSYRNPSIYEEIQLVFQKGRVETDSGIVFSTDPAIERGINVVNEKPKFALETYDSLGTKLIGAFLLLTNHFETVTYKRFSKLQDVIANFGGVVKSLMLISLILMHSYSKNSFLLNLFESTYPSPKLILSKNETSTVLLGSKDAKLTQTEPKTLEQNISKILDDKSGYVFPIGKNTINNISQIQPKISFPFFMCNYGKHKKLYRKIKNFILDKCEVKTLLRTQDDVQKLKCLLLNKKEIEVVENVGNNNIISTLNIGNLEEHNEVCKLLNMLCNKREFQTSKYNEEELFREYEDLSRKMQLIPHE